MQSDDTSQVPTPATKKSVWDKAKKTLSDVSAQTSKVTALGTAGAAKTAEIGKQTLEAGKQAYTGSMLESAVNLIDSELDQRGAKKVIKNTTGAVVGKLDQVTGKRLIELLEEKLRIQDTYNDILATRLAEALERIAKLEAKVNK